jgi:hypothetical protein
MISAPTSFASAAQRLSSARIGARERRRFFRAPVVLDGRMLDPLGREHDCRTADISPGDARIAAPMVLDVGHRVVLYLEGVGRVSGVVARRCGENEFAIIFDGSAHKREKLAETLMWLLNKSRLDADEAPRRASASPHTARLETEDGRLIDGEILDFSLTGVTVRCAKAPPLGAWVRVGAVHGRVARWVEGGFAVDFEPRPDRGG